MTLNEKLSRLFNEVGDTVFVGHGRIRLFNHGYIHLSEDTEDWFVSHSTHKKRHISARGGPDPFGIKFSKSDQTAKAAFILTSSKLLQYEQNEWWKTEVKSTTSGLSDIMIGHIDKAYTHHFSS